MTELSEIQCWLAQVLRQRSTLHEDSAVAEQARRFVAKHQRLSPVEQVEIYRQQFWLRHTSALVEDFPGLGGIIGQQAWERLAEEYLEKHPPTSYTLRDLGSHMPEHVEQASYLEHHELCIDMARLEWRYIELFDAPDVAGLDPEKLAAIPLEAWERARITLNPALALLRVRYPVAELRHALKEAKGQVPIPPPAAQNLVLYRLQRNLYHRSVAPAAFALLEALREDAPLVTACERAVAAEPEDAARLEQQLFAWFREWAELGFVVDVSV